ncbi:threonine dehydrogenase-like Zn-dependent dehydrogenase [Peribacillus frigoritolerans]
MFISLVELWGQVSLVQFSKGYEMVMPELFKKITNNEFDPRDIITHKMSLEEASHGYRIFNNREDECIKVVLKP